MRKPKFRRQDWWKVGRLGEKWRKPRGLDSKMRLKMKGRAATVSIGYGSPAKTRGQHPLGLREVLVRNLRDIERVDPSTQAARVSSSVGRRLYEQMMARAWERRISVLNQRQPKPKEEPEPKESKPAVKS